jgi:hypothetical protein
MHVYSTQHQSHTAYIPVPMNIPSNPAYAQPSLTSYGAKHPIDGSHYSLSAHMSHSYSTPSMMNHSTIGFSSSLPTSISAPIPIRRHTLSHIAYPDYGREEAYEASSQSYDSSIQSPISVQSPNERSFSDTEYEVAGSYATPVMSTPFRGATTVIESGSPYNVHHSRGHAQEGSDGSNSGWRTVAANVIDWSGRAHGGHSRDSSSGSTASNATAIGEQHSNSVPYPLNTHSEFPMTPRSVNSRYVVHQLTSHKTNPLPARTTTTTITSSHTSAPLIKPHPRRLITRLPSHPITCSRIRFRSFMAALGRLRLSALSLSSAHINRLYQRPNPLSLIWLPPTPATSGSSLVEF